MKKILLVSALLLGMTATAQKRYTDDSFTTLSNPADKELIADETYYQPINGRKAILTTYNDRIAAIVTVSMGKYIQQYKTKGKGQNVRHVFYLQPCRETLISLLK